MNSVVPAPQELRRSENDTVILPWLWDIPNALGTAQSQLPNRATAFPFFEYRNGFILGYNDRVIAARPSRLEVLDVSGDEINVVLSEIASDRFEQDPVDAWRSVFNEYLYVLPRGRSFTLIDTADGSATSNLTYDDLITNGSPLQIGERMSYEENALTQVFLGEGYLANNGLSPMHVQLVDVLEPVTPTAAPNQFVLYAMDEATARASIRQVTLEVAKVALSADRTKIAFQRFDSESQLEVYDIASGDLIRTITPALPDLDGRAVFDFDPTGTQLLYDFQRFDIATGDVVFEELVYNPGFDDFYFDANSNRLTTYSFIEGNNFDFRWWQWDINTGEIVRRERVQLRGSIRQTWYTGDRFLLDVSVNEGGVTRSALEIVEIGKDERPVLVFENVPGASVGNIFPSPDWTHAAVFYFNDQDGTTDLALYSFENGLEWYMSGRDLPPGYYGEVFWADENTLAVPAPGEGLREAPTVYWLDYHPSGLPTCLVDAFPERYRQWEPVWERRVEGLGVTSLNQLAEDICTTVEDEPAVSEQQIEQVLTTPTPTRVPTQSARFRATQPVLAGVPACITLRFEGEAERYADVWRTISAGLSLEDAQELENIVCEGITSTGSGGGGAFSPTDGALLIDIDTQERVFTRTIPRRASRPFADYSLEVVRFEYERANEFNRTLNEPKISPDGRLIAQREGPYIEILRLNKPYSTMAAEATATQSIVQSQTPDAVFLSLQPTVTPTSELVGLPRPTVTPTVTPTSPPLPEQTIPLANLDEVVDYCEPDADLFTLANAPESFSPAGTVYVAATGERGVWSLDPRTGDLNRDPSVPDCHAGGCSYSYNQNWILYNQAQPFITSADGSIVRQIIGGDAQASPILSVNWLPGTNVVRYTYASYEQDAFAPEVFIQEYDPAQDFYTEPQMEVTPTPAPQINELQSTQILSVQPVQGRYTLASTSFNTGRSTGLKYYMLDNLSGDVSYFAREDNPFASNSIDARWDELGRYLYYRFEGNDEWYVFDVNSATHYVYGERLPAGERSRDGRYRAEWSRPDEDEIRERIDAGLPIPKLYVWDVDTGGLRRYCIPQTGRDALSSSIDWSPDGRYITFEYNLPQSFYDDSPTPIPGTTPTPFFGVPNSEPQFQAAITRTFVLDLQTGDVVQVSGDVDAVLLWVQEGGE